MTKCIWMILAMVVVLEMGGDVRGQLAINSANANYSQNFNSYSGTLATVPAGWTVSFAGTAAYNGTGTGTSSTGGAWAYGSGGDFSFGALRTNATGAVTLGSNFTNSTGLTIQAVTLAWNYEQYVFNKASGFTVSGTNGLASSSFTGKNFTGVANTGTPGATTPIGSFDLTSLTIANTGTFGINWLATDVNGNNSGIAIDDFSLGIKQFATSGATTAVTSLAYGATVTVVNGHGSASTLDANISASENFQGVLQDGGANPLSLIKSGSATLTLSVLIPTQAARKSATGL